MGRIAQPRLRAAPEKRNRLRRTSESALRQHSTKRYPPCRTSTNLLQQSEQEHRRESIEKISSRTLLERRRSLIDTQSDTNPAAKAVTVVQTTTATVVLLISAWQQTRKAREGRPCLPSRCLMETRRGDAASRHITHRQTRNRMPEKIERL